MARPLRIEYPGAFYHIIQRGNDKKNIFVSDHDREKFLDYLDSLCAHYNTRIHTYCLMDNHYHLTLETKEANLSKAMHYLNTSYTVYFNIKRKRSGHLFRGRYKAILVEANEYLHHLSRYIHLNPVRAGLTDNPINYAHSSYKYFVAQKKPPEWLDTGFTLSLFDKNIKKAKALYRQFVVEGIGKESDIIRNNTAGGIILGSKDFIEAIKEKFIENKEDKEIPALGMLRTRLNPDDIRRKTIKVTGENKISRKISIYLIRKYTSLGLKEIAALFNNISYVAVTMIHKRVEKKRQEDRKFNAAICEIEETLNVKT